MQKSIYSRGDVANYHTSSPGSTAGEGISTAGQALRTLLACPIHQGLIP